MDPLFKFLLLIIATVALCPTLLIFYVLQDAKRTRRIEKGQDALERDIHPERFLPPPDNSESFQG
jgi:hypothetical protein